MRRSPGFLAAMLAAVAVVGAAGCAKRDADPRQAARGEHLARALGCPDCHAPQLTGHKVSQDDAIAVLYSANLTRAVGDYDDDQLRRVLTTGVRPDGTRLWYMDAAPYAVLSTPDMDDLIAWLRSQAPQGRDRPRIRTSPRFDALVKAGVVRPESSTLARDLANPPASLGPKTERGRYLARAYCAGCHAPSLRGPDDPRPGDPPDLAVVAAYARPQFHTLLSRGRAPGDREVGEMSDAARKRFSHLGAAEVDALYDYLSAWGAGRGGVPKGG